jgi:hypothetical protein
MLRLLSYLSCGLFLLLTFTSNQSKSQAPVFEAPFDFYRNEIILQVKINGKGPLNMMLDTGTDPSGIDVTTARELGLKLEPLGKPATGGGTDVNLTYYTKLAVVEVGGLTVKNLETLAIDLSKISERLGKPLHGVLGHSLLNGRVVQIDYPNRKMRIYSQSPFQKQLINRTQRNGQSCLSVTTTTFSSTTYS